MDYNYGSQIIDLLLYMGAPLAVLLIGFIAHNKGWEHLENKLKVTPPGIIPFR